MGVEERLMEAAEAGELVTVIYHGGSQPGTKRCLSPITVTAREIRARDIPTGEVKNFLASKIEVVPDDHPAEDYVVGAILPPVFSTLVEALEARVKELETLGWYVQLSETGVSVHRYFKSGKPKKGADAGILKQEGSLNRPWYVYGPDLASARTFSHLKKAVDLFLEQAYCHAPEKKSNSALNLDALPRAGELER